MPQLRSNPVDCYLGQWVIWISSSDLYGRPFVSKLLFDMFNELFGMFNELFGMCNELLGMCNELFGMCNELFGMCNELFGIFNIIIWYIQ